MRGPSLDLRLQQAVDGLYEAIAAPEAWADTLDSLDRLFGSISAHLFLWDNTTNRRVAAHRSRSFAENHPEWDHFQRINPRRKILLGLPYGTPMNCADYLDDAAVQRSEYFVDYSLPAGRRYLLGTYVIKQASVVTACAVMRAPGQKPFDRSDTAMFARLMPHLRRAARIDRRLRGAREEGAWASAALDRLADAVLVVDASARIVRANAAGRAMFEAAGPLRAKAGRLRAGQDGESERLCRLIADAAGPMAASGTNSGGTIVLAMPGGERWAVLVAPLMPRAAVFDLSDRRLALVTASPLGVPGSIELRLRQAFALTPAEARLAGRIIAGQRLEDISSELSISLATLRTQLKTVFEKTETRRQGQLMQLGLRLAGITEQ
jgi:DNA-binding CsgD family transcriptional regulator/PAS domain-containing protein